MKKCVALFLSPTLSPPYLLQNGQVGRARYLAWGGNRRPARAGKHHLLYRRLCHAAAAPSPALRCRVGGLFLSACC